MEKEKIAHQIEITRFDGKTKSRIKDHIIDEEILEIFINDTLEFQMVFSRTDIAQLAAGFLFTQAIIRHKKQIISQDISKDSKQCRMVLDAEATDRLALFKAGPQVKGSSGGAMLQNVSQKNQVSPAPAFTISPAQVSLLIQQHWEHSKLFQKTGAVHSAALCSKEKILSYHEDIGRHNALDKLAGHLLLNQIDTKRKVATVSCRMSLEIVGKLIRTQIPIVISNAAPTLGAVRLAARAGLTIVGFARNQRFNVYTHDARIT